MMQGEDDEYVTNHEQEQDKVKHDEQQQHTHNNKPHRLSNFQAAMILTAECLGVGVLALPHDVHVLGGGGKGISSLVFSSGVGFLLVNVVLNLTAGHWLAMTATQVEQQEYDYNVHHHDSDHPNDTAAATRRNGHHAPLPTTELEEDEGARGIKLQQHVVNGVQEDTGTTSTDGVFVKDPLHEKEGIFKRINKKTSSNPYASVPTTTTTATTTITSIELATLKQHSSSIKEEDLQQVDSEGHELDRSNGVLVVDSVGATAAAPTMISDMIAMTTAVFRQSYATRIVIMLYYANLFLILGDYMLVMSHAVTAMVGDGGVATSNNNSHGDKPPTDTSTSPHPHVHTPPIHNPEAGEILCLPAAGAIASLLMFVLCQLDSMASLGKEASAVSLLAIAIVLIQCLLATRTAFSDMNDDNEAAILHPSMYPSLEPLGSDDDNATLGDDGQHDRLLFRLLATTTTTTTTTRAGTFFTASTREWLQQCAALASIGFAIGSQKLFLNIRAEMQHPEYATRILAASLSLFGGIYVLVIALAGNDPPSFLFDAIAEGRNRQWAGFLLWIHVAVSYAINSQALCASLDRWLGPHMTFWSMHQHPSRRWKLWTLTLTILSFLVANAIPFFKDLVSLIGALTTVPLTLTLPVLLYRHQQGWSSSITAALQSCSRLSRNNHLQENGTTSNNRQSGWFLPCNGSGSGAGGGSASSCASWWLGLYSIIFLGMGLAGALYSIDRDWAHHGRPFSCH